MPNKRTACPRHEVFTFCWVLLSLFFLPPLADPPSLCGGGQSTGRNEGLGRRPEQKERNTVAWSLTVCMCRTKEVMWTAEWRKLRIEQGNDWSRTHLVEREGRSSHVTSDGESEGSLSLQPGVKGNMFPTNTQRKRLTGLSQQGRCMEGAEGVSREQK